MTDLKYFFQYLKGRCHGNQFSGKHGAKLPPPTLIALLIKKGMGYRLANMHIYSSADCATSCEKNGANQLKWGRK